MPFRCMPLSTSFILRQVFDLFLISLHSLKLCASHYIQCTETTYFRCRHYTQYYQARIFFHFITSLTIYVHLITISHLRQFPSVVYISLYLFIFRFFSSYYTQALSRELTSGVQLSHPPAPSWISGWFFPPQYCNILWYQTHARPALPTCGPPVTPLQGKKEHWLPLDLTETLPILPLTHRDHLNSLPHLHSEGVRGEGL